MDGHLTNAATTDQDLGTRVGDTLNILLKLTLLALGVVLEFLSALDQNSAFRISVRSVNALGENGNFGVADLLNASLSAALENHALDNGRLGDGRTHNLGHAHIVHIEIVRIFGTHLNTGFGNQGSKNVFITIYLAADGRLETFGNGGLVSEVKVGGTGDDQVIEKSKGLLTCLGVSIGYFSGVKSIDDEAFGLGKELTAEGKDEVRSITHLIFLSLGSHSKKLSSRMEDIKLADNSAGVAGDKKFLKMIDNHLIHTVGAHRSSSNFSQILASFNVFKDCLLEATIMLVTLLQHGLKAVRHTHCHFILLKPCKLSFNFNERVIDALYL
mmetsp:Transcript_31717/g.57631  ORF Transcript_31717/g.57631 Transcript_31717/m.57631 type:complete len:328 (+) Transcript_31717:774-1757(+)